MDTLNSLNPVRGNRQRASSSVSALPIPQAPEHTNHRHYQIESNLRRHPYSVLSSSAPSISQLSAQMNNNNNNNNGHNNNSSADLHHKNYLHMNANEILGSFITLDFEGGTHVIVRPNRIIRGTAILDLAEKTLVTRIRIKFRGEEFATVKVDESSIGGKSEWIHQMITTFFEEDYKLFGNEATPYSQSAWEELDAGRYEFPFALKFPNVNYPPSMEEPPGFGIRYIWSVHVDGPGLQSGLKSKEYITPYRPIIVSTEAKEWTYKTTLFRDKKQPIAEVHGKLYKQSYCPDEPFSMQLNISILHSECKINAIHFKFRKHHEGKMVIQQGTAFRDHIRTVIQGKIPINSNCNTHISEEVTFDVPTRLVSPSFISRNTRVCYDLQFQVHLEHGHVFKSETVAEFAIPFTIANLPFEQLLRIPDITSIQFYQQSKECPLFFNPELNEPPEPQGLPSELLGPLTAAMNTPASGVSHQANNNMEEPPSYFSLPTLPPQLELRKERKEKTVFTTTSAKSAYNISDIESAVIIRGLYDEGW